MPPSTINLAHIRSLAWTLHTTYTPSTIITYNLSLGAPGTSLPLVYEGHPHFHALPTFGTLAVIAAMGAVTRTMADWLPGFQPHFHVHGQHYLEVRRPWPVPDAGGSVALVTEARVRDVVGRKGKGGGVSVVVGITTYETTAGERGGKGEEICYNEWTSIILRVPSHGASTTASSPQPRAPTPAIPSRPPDKVLVHRTTVEQSALYRAASGDLNPLHIDPTTAKRGGFPGPILTGTCTLGIGVRHVLETFEGMEVESVGVRLSAPVFPGEEVRTEMWVLDDESSSGEKGLGVVYRQAVGERVVMRDGLARLRRLNSKRDVAEAKL